MLQAADSTVQHVSEQRPGSMESKNFVAGARLSWNNVMVALNSFTQAQAQAVPQLGDLVGTHKIVTTAWLNALYHLNDRVKSS